MRTENCKECCSPRFVREKISILCPTRARPNNVLRLVNSIEETKSKNGNVEVLFFVDQDDETLPELLNTLQSDCIKVISGPRQWISNAHNVLYNFADGEILMTAGDDMVFETPDWDVFVSEHFKSSLDKIGLLFGDDGGPHSGKLAIHGFFHQHWIHVLGSWVQPGRGSLWDLWSSENAERLGRLKFEPNIRIVHIHYRQGAKQASFDDTYRRVYESNSSFRPIITYKKMSRERRIDRILLREAMNDEPPLELRYFLGEIMCKLFPKRDRRRFLSMSNSEFVVASLRFIAKRLFMIRKT